MRNDYLPTDKHFYHTRFAKKLLFKRKRKYNKNIFLS